jgi:two-component system CheB/CheR fusion protein
MTDTPPPEQAAIEAAPTPQPDGQPSGPSFPIIGVGASAGGLEAFTDLLHHMPADPGIALLFVQHMEPDRPSHLRDILARATTMGVHQAQNGMRIEPNHIYVIPPDAEMAIADGSLRLTPRPDRRTLHMPIDHLFRSLAEVKKDRAIGVLLSGGGTDGTLGFQAIKSEGGITFAQDEKSAKSRGMPRSAIMEGAVDYILPPGDIARQLARLSNHPYTAAAAPAEVPVDEGAFAKIIELLRLRTGVDFTQYKRSTIQRRIVRRMALRGLESLPAYQRLLQEEPAEVTNLYQDFLIRVTRFFRDEDVFEILKQKVFPELVKGRTGSNPLRVWVAGCATGEEVYSLAICLLEYAGTTGQGFPMKILATDLSEAALDRARSGLYVDNIELDVSPERLRRFFTKINGHYQISKTVRDLCIFSKHNLANDPPFSHLDFISCRNVLIYLDATLQRRVLPVLHYALNPGGVLLLGSSESVGSFSDLFGVLDGRHRVYVKSQATPPGVLLDLGSYLHPSATSLFPPTDGAAIAWTALDVQKEADRVLLARYAPVGVVIDENLTVLQFRGRTGPYLEPAPGTASLDLLRMVREGLLSEVRAAVNRARTESTAVRREGVPIKEAGRLRLVNLEVIPLKVPPSGIRCYLVLFEDASAPAIPQKEEPAHAETATNNLTLAAAEAQITQLQQELAATREYLQSIIEEHESACEELKSASEEILSSNEELQSTNEELQTAKEETQSANEELATLNEELQHRNMQLAQVNNDLLNLLSAVNIPIIMVGRDLRIRRFTPLAEKVLNLIPSDVGRLISDLNPNLHLPDLPERISQVIDNLVPEETDVQDKAGRWYSLRIRPYVTLENKIEGASVTLLDIDSLKQSIERLKAQQTA